MCFADETAMKVLALALGLWTGWNAPAWAMDQHVEGTRLVMSGPVDGLDYERFLKLVGPGVQIVELVDSRGGDHQATMDVSQEIRRRGLKTMIRGYCLSACALMFLGGVERSLATERSFAGFHGNYRAHSDQPSMANYSELARLMSEMTGGKLDSMIDTILTRTRHGFVYFFNDKVLMCEGTEKRRPWNCAKLDVDAMQMGVITNHGNEQ